MLGLDYEHICKDDIDSAAYKIYRNKNGAVSYEVCPRNGGNKIKISSQMVAEKQLQYMFDLIENKLKALGYDNYAVTTTCPAFYGAIQRRILHTCRM